MIIPPLARRAWLADRRFAREIAIAAACALLPGLWLFFAVDGGGVPYYEILARSPVISVTDLGGLARNFADNILPYLIDPLRSAHIFYLSPGPSWSSALPLALCLAAALAYGIRAGGARRSLCLCSCLAGAICLAFLAMSLKVWAMHHTVLAWPFFMLAALTGLAEMRERCPRLSAAWLAVFAAINLRLFTLLPGLPPNPERVQHANLALFSEWLDRFPGDRLTVVLDWGLYYIKALYGRPGQAVVYIQPFETSAEAQELQRILAESKRTAIFVFRDPSASDLSLLRESFPSLRPRIPPFDVGDWKALVQD